MKMWLAPLAGIMVAGTIFTASAPAGAAPVTLPDPTVRMDRAAGVNLVHSRGYRYGHRYGHRYGRHYGYGYGRHYRSQRYYHPYAYGFRHYGGYAYPYRHYRGDRGHYRGRHYGYGHRGYGGASGFNRSYR